MGNNSSTAPCPPPTEDTEAAKISFGVIMGVLGTGILMSFAIVCCLYQPKTPHISSAPISSQQLEAGDGAGDGNDGSDTADDDGKAPPEYVQDGAGRKISAESNLPAAPPPVFVRENVANELTWGRNQEKSSTSLPTYAADGSDARGSWCNLLKVPATACFFKNSDDTAEHLSILETEKFDVERKEFSMKILFPTDYHTPKAYSREKMMLVTSGLTILLKKKPSRNEMFKQPPKNPEWAPKKGPKQFNRSRNSQPQPAQVANFQSQRRSPTNYMHLGYPRLRAWLT
ncbi:hypothetical protein M413DRAFT_419988 [Hebeloma cylindrosporum]|uniref:Uncharacterized protein n=1 Tax=Hebeloma cylindrosporum TaxID=76867 RepID=A0A0C2XLP0_HEBCY|nr:hypothetical protein M413DRAFT_419988 [Hebeloma cylindrosporum h7]